MSRGSKGNDLFNLFSQMFRYTVHTNIYRCYLRAHLQRFALKSVVARVNSHQNILYISEHFENCILYIVYTNKLDLKLIYIYIHKLFRYTRECHER